MTNDVKTAMKKGEEETFQLSLSLTLSLREVFIDARVFLKPKTAMMKLKTAKNHSVVPCRSSSYRLGIIKMTLFAVAARFQQFINVFPPELS